jgi:hypothetical protein
VAAVTAWSAAATASRLAWRRAFLTDLNMPAVARRTATASGCSGGNDSMSASTCRHVLSLSGSIAFTLEEYGVTHARRRDALLPFFRGDDAGQFLVGDSSVVIVRGRGVGHRLTRSH